MTRRLLAVAFVVAVSLAAHADDRTSLLLARAWPADDTRSLGELGHGVGVVFTPDLSVPNNCRFYQALGFACFESADWTQILSDIRSFNIEHPERPIQTLVLETHGTNGNGLKVQRGKHDDDERSYISAGALQERLEIDGIRYIILSACNSGRLLRPAIYANLDPNNGDRLFLPATCGIVGATPRFNPQRSRVTLITPGSSHIETTLVGSLSELAPETRKALQASAKEQGIALPKRFAISEMLIRILTRDPQLDLRTGYHADEFSAEMSSAEASEKLFAAFVHEMQIAASRSSLRRDDSLISAASR
ncbi:MAG TPA: hypothetical protein VFN10_13900 [Thermoanaerobaculia bacterium]|nr:hypothetical protein [Thermoanaerobaculia bacterium]